MRAFLWTLLAIVAFSNVQEDHAQLKRINKALLQALKSLSSNEAVMEKSIGQPASYDCPPGEYPSCSDRYQGYYQNSFIVGNMQCVCKLYSGERQPGRCEEGTWSLTGNEPCEPCQHLYCPNNSMQCTSTLNTECCPNAGCEDVTIAKRCESLLSRCAERVGGCSPTDEEQSWYGDNC